ncbi:MAG: class I mannose-6-phosphate isomerase [Lachnospiraceae bacterium]|nr:class I mannose-6-phosphate isomerase [Lachnospiraceae bacterium]
MSNKPFLLKPAVKDYLWGGSRLNDDFNLGFDIDPFAEAWVCSVHPDGESVIVGTDKTLAEVLKEHPEYLGSHAASVNNGEMPILIKLIDAKKELSVQVHPDDEYALKNENSLGKTEMWYVLDAKEDTSLVYGFNRDVTEEQVRKTVETGEIESLLNHVPVRKNDLFYIEAGTVHAIGAGCLIAEIQESSNLTYRLYDYNRIDKNGNKRELHVDKAMKVSNFKSSSAPRQPMRVLKYKNGWASELLTRCKYFQVERVLLNTEVHRELVPFKTGSNSFHALLCVDGCGSVSGGDVFINFFKGDCVFVPADSAELKIHGKSQLLNVSC